VYEHLKTKMKPILRTLMNLKLTQKLASWSLVHAPFLLPVKPLRQTTHWIAFCHPQPSYPVHIVLVPKKQWSDWLAVDPGDAEMMREFVELTQSMIREFELTPAGYRLITNGGKNQTFPHLHFHLVAGDAFPEHKRTEIGDNDE
jgi:histidine triad (HIT) family protein